MKFSTIIAGSALVLLGALALAAEANRYNQGHAASHYQGAGSNGRHGGQQAARYNGGAPACRGYHCGAQVLQHNNCKHARQFGPYHAYPVRPMPVIYGGHGLYNYRGYARNVPLPPLSYKSARGHACRGRNCASRRPYGAGASANAHSANAHPARPAAAAAGSYGGLKPVKALVLAPVTYTDNYTAPRQARGARYGSGGHREQRANGHNRYRSANHNSQYRNNHSNNNNSNNYQGNGHRQAAAGKQTYGGNSSGGY